VINPVNPSGPGVSEVISDQAGTLIYDNNSVKIPENKEPREKESGVPESIRNPRI
jgi:hypothetical protein